MAKLSKAFVLFIRVCMHPVPHVIDRGGWILNLVTILAVVGLPASTFLGVTRVESAVSHIPGGRTTVVLTTLLVLVSWALLRVVWREVSAQDWEPISQALHAFIEQSHDLENRVATAYQVEWPPGPVDSKGAELRTIGNILDWMADMVDWGFNARQFIEQHWGFDEASQFSNQTVVLSGSKVTQPPPDEVHMRRAVVERRAILVRLQTQGASKLRPVSLLSR